MNLEEARRELGVTSEASTDLVRRSYLRLLKTRKPETDPDGFQRLREAYELVKLGAMLGEPAKPPRPVPDAALEASALEASEEPRPDPAPVEVFLGKGVAAALAEKDLDAAVEAAHEQLDAVLAHPERPAWLEGAAMFTLAFELYVAGRARDARSLTKKLRQSFDRSGNEARVLHAGAAAAWAVLRELAALPRKLPDDVFAGFARSMLMGTSVAALAALERVRESGHDMDALGADLRDKAPSLWALYGAAWQPKKAPFWSARTPIRVSGYAIFFIGSIVLRMLTSSRSPGPVDLPPERDLRLKNVPVINAPVTTAPSPLPPPENPAVFKEPAAHAKVVADKAKELHEDSFAHLATAISVLADGGACTGAAREFAAAKDLMKSMSPQHRLTLAVPVNVLRGSLIDACHLDPTKVP